MCERFVAEEVAGPYGVILRNHCCEDASCVAEDAVDCDVPRTGKCVAIPECPDYYRFNIWTEVCEYIEECPTADE